MDIIEPTLILDSAKCRKNIRSMLKKAAESEASFRPHFKTHNSREIGRWFREEGVDKITVSSVKMAGYFA
ncbi:MAG: alanine racemase, partial [Candidatus Aminicenantes bacterium]|nr:alanine racemase [Candidatus Aminicenantes bacterium]